MKNALIFMVLALTSTSSAYADNQASLFALFKNQDAEVNLNNKKTTLKKVLKKYFFDYQKKNYQPEIFHICENDTAFGPDGTLIEYDEEKKVESGTHHEKCNLNIFPEKEFAVIVSYHTKSSVKNGIVSEPEIVKDSIKVSTAG